MNGCIITTYRDRAEHLAQFVPHYRDVLPIYVIEQADDKPFNRAKLLNIGFLEAGYKYDYAVYHDVDMLAENFSGYKYWELPTHLASACSQFAYTVPFEEYFGGVTSIPTHIMRAANGFSNKYYGWGAEDNDMYEHLNRLGFECQRYGNNRYKSLAHERHIDQKLYDANVGLLTDGRAIDDGLSSCTYEILSTEQKDGYTLIKAIL